MDYAIKTAGTITVSALLDAAGASAEGIKAVWLSYPTATFVPAKDFGAELEVVEGTEMLRIYDETSCMCDALCNVIGELRMATECTCTFGHEGGYQLHTILSDGCNKKGKPSDIALIRDLAPVMQTQASIMQPARNAAFPAISVIRLLMFHTLPYTIRILASLEF